jgi:spore coat protein U-like protein
MKFNFKQHALKSALVSAFALGAVAFGANGYAAQGTTTFGVSATVTASCTISGTALDFGSFNTLAGDIDSSSTLTATCSDGAPYTIGLSAGTTAGAAVTTRKLAHGVTPANTLNYNLSPVSSGGINWDLIGGTTTKAGTGNGAGQLITVFGRIPAGQTSAIMGAYSDTITATIDF